MPPPSVLAQGIVARKKGAPSQDGNRDGVPFRTGRYSEEYNLSLIPKNHLLADEGSYFVSSTPTPGTGIIGIAAMTGIPTLGAGTDLNPYIVAYNSAQPSDGTRCYLDALQLLTITPGTNGVGLNFAVQTDLWANRVKNAAAMGGTLLTPVNANQDDGTAPVLKVWMGANVLLGSNGTAGQGGSARLFPRRQFRPVITVAGDIYAMTFGGSEQFVGSLISSGTAICQQSFNYPPIIIGPQQVALIYLWSPSQTVGATFDGDVSWWER